MLCVKQYHTHNNKCLQAAPWYECETVQTGEEQWDLQPNGGFCMLCGRGVDALMHSENMSREAVIAQAQEDRVFLAKLLVLHLVLKDKIPRGFEASVVKTVHRIRQVSNAEVLAVNLRHFNAHNDLKMCPTQLPGNRLEQRPFDVMNSELGLAKKHCHECQRRGYASKLAFYQGDLVS